MVVSDRAKGKWVFAHGGFAVNLCGDDDVDLPAAS